MPAATILLYRFPPVIPNETDMITVAVVTRRLKEGKTYEDFRKAWYHTVGFGTPSTLYTMINVADPREIMVIGLVETGLNTLMAGLEIDVRERLGHPLDDVIEPGTDRQFGILVAKDDFSAEGTIGYRPPAIDGKDTDIDEVSRNLTAIATMVAKASEKRDQVRAALAEKSPGKELR
jgi:hypothetical protein